MSVSRCAATATMLGLAITLVGCAGTRGIDDVGLPNPPFSAMQINCADTANTLNQLNYIAYARELSFITTHHDSAGNPTGFVGDLVEEPTPGNRILGPVAEIWPEGNSLHNGGGALAEGRVIARVNVRDSVGFTPLGLPADTSWIAVCKANSSDTTGIALIIPADTAEVMRARPVRLIKVRGKKHAHAVFQGGASSICVTCEHKYWCHVDP